MKNLRTTETIAVAASGAILVDCVQEAIVIAVQEQRLVRFTHNDQQYVVDPRQLEDSIMEQNP